MSDLEKVEITKENLQKAYKAGCPDVKRVLRALCPDILGDYNLVKICNEDDESWRNEEEGIIILQITDENDYDEYGGHSVWLHPGYNWEMKEIRGDLLLIPKRK